MLTYLLADRLLAGPPDGWWLALLAPVLLLADGLFLAQARIAMLDIHLTLFTWPGRTCWWWTGPAPANR